MSCVGSVAPPTVIDCGVPLLIVALADSMIEVDPMDATVVPIGMPGPQTT